MHVGFGVVGDDGSIAGGWDIGTSLGRGTFCMLAYQQVTLCILVRESEKRCGVTCCILINLRFRNEKVTSSNPVSGTITYQRVSDYTRSPAETAGLSDIRAG